MTGDESSSYWHWWCVHVPWNRDDTMSGKWVVGLVQTTKIDKISPKREDLASCFYPRLRSLKSRIFRKISAMSPKRREKYYVMRNQNPGNLLTLKAAWIEWVPILCDLTQESSWHTSNYQLSRVIRLIGWSIILFCMIDCCNAQW